MVASYGLVMHQEDSSRFDSKGSFQPQKRKGAVRVVDSVTFHIRSGHPFVYRESLGDKIVTEESGSLVDLVDANGYFLASGIYDKEGPIAVRIISRKPYVKLGPALFEERIRNAATLRKTFLPTKNLSAVRVFHGEGDFFPGFTVDKYDDFLLVHCFSDSLSAYINDFIKALALVWSPKGIYLQKRFRPQTGEGVQTLAELVWGNSAPAELTIQENELSFSVEVCAPFGTGLFLDLREGRKLIQSYAAGRKALNLFSYTGAISTYLAKGGASHIVSIDLSSKAHSRARKNLTLNHLSEDNHDFIVGDVFATLARFANEERTFDLLVVDPPSFSQTKGRAFSSQKDYAELLAQTLLVADKESYLFCISNTFKLSKDELVRSIGVAAVRSKRQVQILGETGLPQDFPIPAGFAEGNYLKCFMCRVL